MSSILQAFASLSAAGALLVSGALETAAPQNSDTSMLLLVNREWRISENYLPEVRVSDVPGQVRRLRGEAGAGILRDGGERNGFACGERGGFKANPRIRLLKTGRSDCGRR